MPKFVKMHGLGNDFAIFDRRDQDWMLENVPVEHLCQRRHGIGCDQLIVLDQPKDDISDIFMHIYNADGSKAEVCGNAMRCVADLIWQEKDNTSMVLETVAGIFDAQRLSDQHYSIDMGLARFDWRDIPLSRPVDSAHIPLSHGPLSDGCGVNVGNPHIVFFVDDIAKIDLATVGPGIENDPLFPQRTNVEVVQVQSGQDLQVRVWERGAGETSACGSGACAALLAAVLRQKIPGRKARVYLKGGALDIIWLDDNHVTMSGSCREVFRGEISW